MAENIRKKESKKRLTIQDRIDILNRLNSGETCTRLAKEYKVSAAAITKIKNNKEKILANEKVIKEQHGSLLKKRAPTVENTRLEKALYSSFLQNRSRGEPISGEALKAKALLLNEKLDGPTSFRATDGYLKRFKQRHGILHVSVQGEKLSADKEASTEFCQQFREMVLQNGYTMDEIYNGDETGLWWKMLPRKTFFSYEETRADGYKIAKDRLTLMVCANASGTHKLPVFVIGKSMHPRCFKNITTLPVTYTGQKNAWMDTDRFMQWYTQLFLPEIEKKHSANSRKCILLLDNAPTHPPAEKLNSSSDKCTVIYLPPNVTALIQPIDQGVIEKLKKVYHKNFLKEFLLDENNQQTILQFLKGWNVLKTCIYVAEAWTSLTTANLQNSWKNLLQAHPESFSNDEQLDVNTFSRLFHRSSCFRDITDAETEEWLDEDATDQGWRMLSDKELLFPENISINEESNINDEITGNEVDLPVPTAEEALLELDKFQAWFQTRWEFGPQDWTTLYAYREVAVTEALAKKFPNGS